MARSLDEGRDTALQRLEYELTLFSRHYLATLQHRPEQHLDRSAYLILARLDLDEQLTLGELAAAFRLDVSTVNRQVAAMRKQGLVERRIDPDGGAARKVCATERGLELLAADRARSRRNVALVVEQWSPDDVELMSRMVARFNSSIEALEDNPWPRPEHAGP